MVQKVQRVSLEGLKNPTFNGWEEENEPKREENRQSERDKIQEMEESSLDLSTWQSLATITLGFLEGNR